MLAVERTPPILSIIILVAMISPTAQAGTSVYVISDNPISKLQAYKVEDNNLVYQPNADYTCESDPSYGSYGAVGIAVSESEFLFVTFENSNKIELVNAKSMVPEGEPVKVPGPTGAFYRLPKNSCYLCLR